MTEQELKERLQKAYEGRLEVHIRVLNHYKVWQGMITEFDSEFVRIRLDTPTPAQDILVVLISTIVTLRVPAWEKVER